VTGTADTLELQLTSDPKGLSPVRAEVRTWLEGHGWEEARIGELVLALDEALTNVIRHGYGGAKDGRILVTLMVTVEGGAGSGVEIRVRDFGRQVDPTKICGRDLDDIRPGGLGVHIMRAMMSSIEYRCMEGGGMLLTMRKHKTHTATQPAPQRGTS
jgi:anti-sigma regulatory factor (Ser/Thr protein kinase)